MSRDGKLATVTNIRSHHDGKKNPAAKSRGICIQAVVLFTDCSGCISLPCLLDTLLIPLQQTIVYMCITKYSLGSTF